MAITSTAGDGVRITTAAKDGTLGSQAAAAANEIIFDTNISTNNGNLETLGTPTFVGRKVIVRQGTSDEETRYITAIAGDGVTATVNEDWVSQPASGDTYHVSYILRDCESVTGVTFTTKTGLFVFGRNFTVGNAAGGAFAYFSITDYLAMEMDDSGNADDFTIDATGRMDMGYLQGGKGISGGVITNTKTPSGEPYANFIEGGVLLAYASIFWSQVDGTIVSNPTSVTGNIKFTDCTFIKTAYTAQFSATDMTRIIWQGTGDFTNDTFRIR